MALTFWSTGAFPDSGADTVFTSGLESFKKQDLAQSREHFTQLLAANPNDPTLLYNLGLVELTDNHPGRALGYWRKALYLNPGSSPALAGLRQLQKLKGLPQLDNMGLLESFYLRFPVRYLFFLSWVFLLASGYFWVLFRQRRKNEQPAPLGAAVSCTLLLLVITGLGLHGAMALYSIPKATVMADNVPVYSSPSTEAPSLFEFREGDEVVVHRTDKDWAQVQRSATSVGWVKQNQIFYHSGI